MNRTLAIVAMFLVGALAACDSQPPPPAAKKPAVPAKPARGPWPFLAAEPGAARDFDPQAVIKRNYYVVFDASGSMSEKKCSGAERKIDVAKRAVLAFAGQMSSDANLGLLVFDQRATRELMPIGPISKAALADVIRPIEPGGDTPLADAIRRAYAALTKRAVLQLGYGEYHLVVVTDGEATGEDPRSIVNQLIGESPVVLHTIGFCIGADHSLNQLGRTVYQSADNPQELAQGLTDVLAEAPSFDVKSFK
jgi:Ca-activated chloride channel homolog